MAPRERVAFDGNRAKPSRPTFASLIAAFVAALLLAGIAGCSDDDEPDHPEGRPTDDATVGPSPTYVGPGEVRVIESTTQMHLKGVAVGVGNIWDEDYTPAAGGAVQHGLTAMLSISVEADASQLRQVRVHPGQELTAPGYRFIVVSVEKRLIRLAVVEVPK